MDVQIVVHLLLDEVAHILVDALSARSHLQRSELNLGLRLEHRLLHVDGDGSHEAVTDVRKLVVLREKLLYGACDVLLEGALMGAALRGVLSVDEGMIFLAVLVGMREGNLDVLALHVYDGIERFGGHRVCEQVGKSVARHDAPTVIHYGQTGVEIGVVAEHRLHEIVMERVADEECRVRLEEDVRSVLVLRWLRDVALQHATLKDERPHRAVTVRAYLEAGAERIDRLDAHTVQTHALLERLRVVFSSGVEHADRLNELALRDAASVVADGNALALLHVHFDALSGVHLKLVDGVVHHLFEQDVDAVLRQIAVAESSDVHTRTRADMLHVGEVSDVVVGILYCWFLDFFFHICLLVVGMLMFLLDGFLIAASSLVALTLEILPLSLHLLVGLHLDMRLAPLEAILLISGDEVVKEESVGAL